MRAQHPEPVPVADGGLGEGQFHDRECRDRHHRLFDRHVVVVAGGLGDSMGFVPPRVALFAGVRRGLETIGLPSVR